MGNCQVWYSVAKPHPENIASSQVVEIMVPFLLTPQDFQIAPWLFESQLRRVRLLATIYSAWHMRPRRVLVKVLISPQRPVAESLARCGDLPDRTQDRS
jgi:hypothetical protein